MRRRGATNPTEASSFETSATAPSSGRRSNLMVMADGVRVSNHEAHVLSSDQRSVSFSSIRRFLRKASSLSAVSSG